MESVLVGTPLVAASERRRLVTVSEQLGNSDISSSSSLWGGAGRTGQVLDAQGRRRLHGAFTGGFSAGYYNSVGSAEGWKPTKSFSSDDRRKGTKYVQQRVEDFMDDQDDAALGNSFRTRVGYGSVGAGDSDPREGIISAKAQEMSFGRRMMTEYGWQRGQGCGPRTRLTRDVVRGPRDVAPYAVVAMPARSGIGFSAVESKDEGLTVLKRQMNHKLEESRRQAENAFGGYVTSFLHDEQERKNYPLNNQQEKQDKKGELANRFTTTSSSNNVVEKEKQPGRRVSEWQPTKIMRKRFGVVEEKEEEEEEEEERGEGKAKSIVHSKAFFQSIFQPRDDYIEEAHEQQQQTTQIVYNVQKETLDHGEDEEDEYDDTIPPWAQQQQQQSKKKKKNKKKKKKKT